MPARSANVRLGVATVLVLWCLSALTIGATQAHCLEVGGGCAPPAGVPAGTCHDQSPKSGVKSDCSSCVDILVPEDSSAYCHRPGRDLHETAAALVTFFIGETFGLTDGAASATIACESGPPPLYPLLRTTVLRI